jgi:hypothetical protein
MSWGKHVSSHFTRGHYCRWRALLVGWGCYSHGLIFWFITYFPWYQCDNTHVINFWYHIVYSYATSFEELWQQKQVWGGQYVIKRISHGLWCDMIFIQLVVCFLSPRHKPWEILYIFLQLLIMILKNSLFSPCMQIDTWYASDL